MYNTFCSYVQHFLFVCTTFSVHTYNIFSLHMYNTFCSYVQTFLFICTKLSVHMYYTFCSYVQNFLFICTTLSVHMYKTFCSFVQYFLFICTTLSVHMYNTFRSYVQHFLFIRTTLSVHMYNTFCSYVQHSLRVPNLFYYPFHIAIRYYCFIVKTKNSEMHAMSLLQPWKFPWSPAQLEQEICFQFRSLMEQCCSCWRLLSLLRNSCLLWNVKVHDVVHKDSPLTLSWAITAFFYSVTTFTAKTAL
jgi:hypothetical protein